MPEKRVFQNKPLTDMVAVGAIKPHRVALWVRSEHCGEIRVEWHPVNDPQSASDLSVTVDDPNVSDNTTVIFLPGSGGNLESMTEYTFRVIRVKDDKVLGEGRFETAPATEEDIPSRYSLAVFSCHQPYDKKGAVQKQSSEMLEAARKCLRQRKTKYVLEVGDQMYSDFPESLSLFDTDYFRSLGVGRRRNIFECSAFEVRRIYQQRYRLFWEHPEWQTLHREFPCYPILDDHDIVDNWGSRPVYQTDKWKDLGRGAMEAYYDYQGSRVIPQSGGSMPRSFHYSFEYGHTATFVMDLRSQRKAGEDGRLFDDRQEQDFLDFLEKHSSKSILFVVMSVPIVHLPRFIARFMASLPHTGEDFSDRWSSGAHVRDRDRMLKILHNHQVEHPEQRIILLGGDIHIACVHEITWNDDKLTFHQLIASPITHKTPYLIQVGSKLLIGANNQIQSRGKAVKASVKNLEGTREGRKNPYGKMNMGMVEIDTPGPGERPRLRFLIYGHKKTEPVLQYCSPWL